MSTSTLIYNILKAIDLAYENQNFDFNTTLSLDTLEISEQRLILLLENLVDDGYIQGITIKRSIGGEPFISINVPRLTNAGLLYLEDNSNLN